MSTTVEHTQSDLNVIFWIIFFTTYFGFVMVEAVSLFILKELTTKSNLHLPPLIYIASLNDDLDTSDNAPRLCAVLCQAAISAGYKHMKY